MNSKEFINKALNILIQAEANSELLKELKEAGKESELDVPALLAAAKAVLAGKENEVIEKNNAINEAIELARS